MGFKQFPGKHTEKQGRGVRGEVWEIQVSRVRIKVSRGRDNFKGENRRAKQKPDCGFHANNVSRRLEKERSDWSTKKCK